VVKLIQFPVYFIYLSFLDEQLCIGQQKKKRLNYFVFSILSDESKLNQFFEQGCFVTGTSTNTETTAARLEDLCIFGVLLKLS
jgi:hypothetical protein